MRRKAATRTPRLGTLFINPGGPGASGKGEVASFENKGLEQYDIVGWDPRGVGDSTPVKCYGDAEADAFNNLDISPDTDAERSALIEGAYDLATSCWENSGSLLEHISTIETVRDLDLLRQLVGDKELHYFGYSYGTQIGATYAELYPAEHRAPGAGRGREHHRQRRRHPGDGVRPRARQLRRLVRRAEVRARHVEAGGARHDHRLLRPARRPPPPQRRPDADPEPRPSTGIAALLYGGKQAWPTLLKALTDGIAGKGGAPAACVGLPARP